MRLDEALEAVRARPWADADRPVNVRLLAAISVDGRATVKARLSPREVDVCRLTLQGLERKEIAAELGISPWTVAEYADGCRRFYDVRHTWQAAILAVADGYV